MNNESSALDGNQIQQFSDMWALTNIYNKFHYNVASRFKVIVYKKYFLILYLS